MTPPPLTLVSLLGSIEAVIVAATALLAALTAGLTTTYRGWRWLKAQITELQQRSGQTLHEVKNDHAKNLREDMDEKFQAVHVKIDALADGLRRLDERDRQRGDTDVAIYRRLGQLAEQDNLLHRRIDNELKRPHD
ncbi:hypothetical protein [Nesterenkonia sp.]|uniref:hypothetical protein n=1 Tax=Nesterenkonia sp. TaxID=704201 RepID=UPI0026209BEC|nr:hypothetical protein [Nesterenkonia sp.]